MAISTSRVNSATITCRRTDRARRWRSSGVRLTTRSSQRRVAVLAPRVLELLVLECGQRLADPPARAMRHDHVVDEAAIGRHERVGELLAILLGARRDLLCITDVGAEDDLDRALGAHHRDL